MENIEDKRIAVLLSGGVDSSVVVYELARQGLHPDCFYIKIGPEEQEEWDCNSEEDMEMATVVAQRYGCRLEVVDCHREYWDQVTRYTMEKVRAGFTPNPDVMCNRLIKFGAFDEKRGHDYDLIATGHYAQTEWIDGRKWLTTSPDPVKDQTDFLAQIHPWQLKKALFPIGHYMKDEVRQVAEREHLINARRKDSQGICFLGNIDYNEYVGRIGIGKVDNGCLKVNQEAVVVNHHEPDKQKKVRISKLYEFDGLNKVDVAEAKIGSIVAISGIADIHIGDTICAPENPVAIPFQKISEPTLSMNFMVNDSPLAGQEGKFITSRHLRDRLFKELNTDVSLRVEETESPDCYKVSGRGELHLSVLVENMRREGYEFAVSKAEVLYHTDENGKKTEPMEIAYVDVPDEFTGTVIDKLSQRKGELVNMKPITGGYTRLEFNIPSRGLIGYRGDFMTDTKGNGVINTEFEGYGPFKGEIPYRKQGSLIAFESGETITYGLFNAQERGTLFVGPGEKVYGGMIVGEHAKSDDIEVNVCKKKNLTNTRSSGADEALRLTPPKELSLEQALDYIDTDELLEVTPENLRIRKKILDGTERYRAKRNAANAAKS